MKQFWKTSAARIDALSLRERAIVFVMIALVLITLVDIFLIDPQYLKQKKLAQQISQDQARIAELQADIQQKISAQAVDPDAANLSRLQQLTQQSGQMYASLKGMQKGLVSPDKMPGLLEAILKRDGRLRLMSLKSLPVSGLLDAVPSAAVKAASDAAAVSKDDNPSEPMPGMIYKHGVEMTVQGNYLDLMAYLSTLEKMPWQLYWGKAKLNVDTYPQATLTLTLYTLSLDKKWLNL